MLRGVKRRKVSVQPADGFWYHDGEVIIDCREIGQVGCVEALLKIFDHSGDDFVDC